MPWLWIAATSVGMGAGLAVGAAVVDYSIDRADLMLMGAITGLGVGALQAVVLARQGFAGAVWWAVANPPTWALAWLISSYVISANIDERFTNFGASGMLLYALVTALLLAWLFRRTESKAPALNLDMIELMSFIEAGTVRPVIDRTYPLSEVPEAIRYLRDGKARGKIVITV